MVMNNRHTCPKCGSDDYVYMNGGLPDALECVDCGYIYSQILSLFPVLKKTESSWPFPTSLRPKKHGLPKYNPNNEEEAPF